MPYAFTEQGIYMLMTVLKGELAVSQSKNLIRIFKQMKDYIIQRQHVLPTTELLALTTQTRNNTEEIRQIKQQVNDLTVVINDFTDKNIKKDYLFYNGQTVEADIAYSEIYSYAEKTIHIIDNYISLKTLVLLKSVPSRVKVTIFSDNVNHGLHQTEFTDFRNEYSHVDVELRSSGGIYHDRYIFIDHATPNEMIFHCAGPPRMVANGCPPSAGWRTRCSTKTLSAVWRGIPCCSCERGYSHESQLPPFHQFLHFPHLAL